MATEDGRSLTGRATSPSDLSPVGSSQSGIANAGDYYVRLIEDKPIKGMWHCGPNPAWVEVTHLPTMISARAFDSRHHAARQAAFACCQMMVEQSRLSACQFPDQLAQPMPARIAQAIEARRAATLGAVHESPVGATDAPISQESDDANR